MTGEEKDDAEEEKSFFTALCAFSLPSRPSPMVLKPLLLLLLLLPAAV